jgi:hypothetical protein
VLILEQNQLLYRERTISIIAHLCSEMAVFDQNSAFRFHVSIRYSKAKHAVLFYLGNRTNAHTEYPIGSTVINLVKF